MLDLLTKCLVADPANRTNASEALSSRFFLKFDPVNLLSLAYPSYWRSRDRSLKTSNSLKSEESTDYPRVDVTAEIGEKIQELITNTSISKDFGYGRDVEKSQQRQKYKALQVLKVERIENGALWSKFSLQKNLMESKLSNRTAHIKKIDTHIDNHWKLEEYTVNANINEKYLWTGTKSHLVPLILNEGLEERVSSLTRNMFGAGIYFAEYASKSDQYLVPDQDGNCYLFLCRVLMGETYILEQTPSLKEPIRRVQDIPEVRAHLQTEPTLDYDPTPHSILAECKRTGFPNARLDRYREMVVYDRSQCYPEFLVTVRRVESL